MIHPPQTSLALLFPELDPVVDRFRMRYDPSAGHGFPPHVTILWPFMPPGAISDETLQQLEVYFRGFFAFDLQFRRTGFSSRTLFLAPEPPEPTIAMINGITRLYPDYPPYNKPEWDPLPHLTVAYGMEPEGLRAIADRFDREAGPSLPVSTTVSRVWLLDYRGDGWKRRLAFDLGPNPSAVQPPAIG